MKLAESLVGHLLKKGAERYPSINLFNGKSVIDIGSRTGEIPYQMALAGATVTCVDPDSVSLKFGIASGYIDCERVYPDKIQNLSEDAFPDKFDLLTCFMFCMDLSDRLSFVEKAKKFLKPDGRMLLGIADNEFIYEKNRENRTTNLVDLFCQQFPIESIHIDTHLESNNKLLIMGSNDPTGLPRRGCIPRRTLSTLIFKAGNGPLQHPPSRANLGAFC